MHRNHAALKSISTGIKYATLLLFLHVARCLVNLKPELRSKDLEPVHEKPQLDRVQEIAHEPGCISCKCQACTVFKTSYNKDVFRGADELYSKSSKHLHSYLINVIIIIA